MGLFFVGLVVLVWLPFFLFSPWNGSIITCTTNQEAFLTSASPTVINSARKHLHNDLARAIKALEQKKIPDFADSIEFVDGLFVMTTATDHKNNLNRTGLKRDNTRRLGVETIANSAAQVAIVAQPSTGFLNGRFYADKSPTEDTEDCLGRTTVGLTRSKSLTILVSPLDMLGLMGMAQVVATIAYGIRGLRTGETTWSWPDFHSDPTQENLGQITRWSLNQAPDWTYPPLAIANQEKDRHTKETKRERYRLILVRGYELDWLREELLRYVLAWTDPPQKMHGLKLMIREEIMPQDDLPSFPALAHLAESVRETVLLHHRE